VQLREGLAAVRATEAELWVPLLLGAVAQGSVQGGQAQDGLRVIAEALAMVEKNDERWSEAELYRLKGQLTLQQSKASPRQVSDASQASLNQGIGQSNTDQDKSDVADPRPLTPDPQVEAEGCFNNALAIARRQEAKSLELRAATSLARLWQQQGKTAEARELLAPVYNWFTEGFDTKDLQEAKMLIEELAAEGRYEHERSH
jgi:predicted ATPase